MDGQNALKNAKYNSEIEIVQVDGVKYIDKKLRLPLPSRQEAEEARQKVILQRQAFSRIHVPTSDMVNIEILPATDESGFVIWIREIFAGLDFMDVVTDDNYSMYLSRLLQDVFKPLLTSTREDYLPAGIDPIPRNFVYNNHKGEFCYVDFVPPKVFYKGKYTQEIPECSDPDFYEVRNFSHNLRAGIVYVTYINLVREFPTQLGMTAGRLEQFLREIGENSLYKYIQESPIYRVHDPKTVKAVISNIRDWKWNNYYLLREIANWINNYNPSLGELKKEVFKATSQERDPQSPDYGRLSQANFSKALELLKEGVEKCE